MGDPGPSLSSEPVTATIRTYLDKSREILQSISRRASSLFDQDGPVTSLIYREIQILEACFTDFYLSLPLPNLIDHGAPKGSVRIDMRQLSSLKRHIVVTYNLLQLAENLEDRGQEGAINALFIKRHYLSDEANIPENPMNEDKLLWIGEDFAHLTKEIWQGRDLDAKGIIDCYQRFTPAVTKTMARIKSYVQPRYVHTCDMLADTPYEIDKHCDPVSGSACIVRKVCHKRTGAHAAMKTYSHVVASKMKKQILQEIGILEVCAHRNIVKLKGAFQTVDDVAMHLVLSPWAPCTLEQLLLFSDERKRRRCPWLKPGTPESDQVVHRIMFELSDAVAYLHERSIKHKDLKPANILLQHEHSGADVKPVITDVGVSKIQIRGMHTRYDDSTYQYLSPEQHDHVSSTLQSDVWQLGCCFAEFLAMARGGSAGWWMLHNSFHRDEESCSCAIAKEHEHVLRALATICTPSNPVQEQAHSIVKNMMELRPFSRPIIDEVVARLHAIVSAMPWQHDSLHDEPSRQLRGLSLSV